MSERTEDRLGTFPYIIAGLSFFPLIGVVFGFATIIWGLFTKKSGGKTLVALGTAGICLTLMLYGSLFYFSQRGGIFDDLRKNLAQTQLNNLVQSIEFYKVKKGRFPKSLKDLVGSLPNQTFIFIQDPNFTSPSAAQREFFFELVGSDKYYLRSVGPDGKPFTGDDVLPSVTVDQSGKVGLLLERQH